MSLFLGPIHHKMWKKILFQNELNNHLFANQDALAQNIHEQFGIITDLSLEDQIETNNIHGWLQEKVDLAENSFAVGVKKMLQTYTIEELSKECEKFGTDKKLTSAQNASEMYEIVQSLLLDGMPCDHVNEVLEQSDNAVSWRQNQNIHEKYWISNQVEPEHYIILRHSLLKGLLEETEYKLIELDNNNYRLERCV